MTITNRAVLKFHSTISGQTVQFSIPRARLDKTTPQAIESMTAIIANGAVLTSEGRPAAIKGAHIISTTRTPITE